MTPMRVSAPQRARVLICVVGLALIATMDDGVRCQYVAFFATLAVAISYFLDSPRFFRLSMLWCAGYMLIIAPEGMGDGDLISAIFSRANFDTAARCLAGSQLAMLLGHALVFSERDVQPSRGTWKLKINRTGTLLIVLTAMTLLYFVPLALQTFRAGRVGDDNSMNFGSTLEAPSIYIAIMQAFSTSVSVAAPIVAVWVSKRVHGTFRIVMFAIVVYFLAAQFLLAVRFLLLFAGTGCGLVWMAPRRPTRKLMAGIIVGVLAMAMVSSVLKSTRTYGLKGADLGEVVSGFSFDEIVMHEQVVWTMAQAVQYTRVYGYMYGESTAGIAVFWVPRAIWRNKPTLIGYWLPRAFGGDLGFGEGFSAAPGFPGEAFVDFGLWGCIFAWLIFGLMFGLLERRIANVLALEQDARTILAAPLYGAAFFAVRSIDTAILVSVGIYVVMGITLLICSERYRD